MSSDAFGQRSGARPQPILVDEIGSMRSKRTVTIPAQAPKVPKATSTVRQVERNTFDLMNAERAAKGLTRLEWDENLAGLARLHSVNMATHNFFSHRGVDGTMVDDRADLLGLGNWNAIGENIAFLRGFDEPERIAVTKWLQSPSHRKNILNATWRESAIGVALANDGSYYFTQVFLFRR